MRSTQVHRVEVGLERLAGYLDSTHQSLLLELPLLPVIELPATCHRLIPLHVRLAPLNIHVYILLTLMLRCYNQLRCGQFIALQRCLLITAIWRSFQICGPRAPRDGADPTGSATVLHYMRRRFGGLRSCSADTRVPITLCTAMISKNLMLSHQRNRKTSWCRHSIMQQTLSSALED